MAALQCFMQGISEPHLEMPMIEIGILYIESMRLVADYNTIPILSGFVSDPAESLVIWAGYLD